MRSPLSPGEWLMAAAALVAAALAGFTAGLFVLEWVL